MGNHFSQEMNAGAQEFDILQPVINIGSHSDNDIVLSGASVLPFHATMIVQDGKFQLIALGAAPSIQIDGVPLTASPASITPQQRIDIGNFSLFFTPDNGTTRALVKLSQSTTTSVVGTTPKASTIQGDSPILVNVVGQISEIDVEQTAYFDLEIINAGQIVASFSVSVLGVPETWLNVSPRVVNLNEGQRATVRVSVTPPRESTSTAGKHTLQAIVQSPNYTDFRSTNQLGMTIRPYFDYSVGNLSPKQQNIFWRKRSGITKLPITNHGNSPADFSVSAVDDENGCSFDFLLSKETQLSRQATLSVPAGETKTLPIEITPLKQAMVAFRSRRYHYTTTIQLTQQALVPQTLSGSVTSVPLIGWWTIVMTLALLLVGVFFLVQPRINSFGVASGKDVIEKGDTTRLEWRVSPFATRFNISNLDQTIKYGQTSLTIAPAQSTTYEFVAGNWLSGLLGLDQKRTQTVLVIPPSPNINVFEVDKTKVAQGVPVTVRWSVTRADQAFLTIDEVVYELKPEEFSGERSVVLPKDALVTLEAKNASGSELRSYFINVVPPSITVNTFTVWVRPQATSALNPGKVTAAKSGNGKLASPIYAPPDPNFPEKYVELIPDKSSDSGYRAEFYQPDRELAKGEQIMLGWDITGVDNNKLQIAPFTEPLPARGAQPFFPQESMNFVMTAKSGDLEKLFMLPVKVFDGTPPVAPKIEFFKGSPVKYVGAVDVQFAWSVSGEWTRIQLSTEGNVVADYINPQGFKTIKVAKSTTFILTAFNGTLSSAAPLEIVIDPALVTLPLKIASVYPETGRFLIGDKLTVNISYEKVTGKPDPTGDIIVTDGVAVCPIKLPARSCDLIFKTPGIKSITASYAGDSIYQQSSAVAFGTPIEVQSAEVSLSPYYYFRNADNSRGTEINDITKTTLAMDKGLYVTIEVQPKNTILPLDGTEKVSASVCDSLNKCTFIGIATVRAAKPNTAENNSFGYADISIQSFTGAGKYSLLFEYRQDDNAINPEQIKEPEIVIGKARISLAFAGCSSPDNLTTSSVCTFGVGDPKSVSLSFDIKNFDSKDANGNPLPLSVSLPAPLFGDFGLQWEDPASSGTFYDWVCRVEVRNAAYKLVCDYKSVPGPEIPTTSVAIKYQYDNALPNNYYMGSSSSDIGKYSGIFNIGFRQSTRVEIGDLGDISVGKEYAMTSTTPTNGMISLFAGSTLINALTLGDITLEETTGKDIFGVVANANCSVVNNKLEIQNPSADCPAYFKTAGSFTIKATFKGDTAYSTGVSGDKQVVVALAQISGVVWKYKASSSSGPYLDWTTSPSWVVTSPTDVRVELSGSSGFTSHALNGRQLLAKFITSNPGSAVCVINPTSSVTATTISGEYLIKLNFDAASNKAFADFPVRCTSTGKMTIELRFASGQDSSDFAISASATSTNTKDINAASSVNMVYTIIRSAGNFSMLPGPKTFNVGETYELQFTFSNLQDYYYYYEYFGQIFYGYSLQDRINAYKTQDYVDVTFPDEVVNNWDTSKSSCDDNPVGNPVKYRVYLNDAFGVTDNSYIYDYLIGYKWHYGDFTFSLRNATPCKMVFQQPVTTWPAINPTMSFFYQSRVSYFLANQSYAIGGLSKQNVTMSFSPANSAQVPVNTSQEFVISLAPDIGQTDLAVLNSIGAINVVVSDPSCGSLSPVSSTGVSVRQAKFTFTAKNRSCVATITVEYTGNDWFNPYNTSNAISITVVAPTPTPTYTPTFTPTSTATATLTSTATYTPTPTATTGP